MVADVRTIDGKSLSRSKRNERDIMAPSLDMKKYHGVLHQIANAARSCAMTAVATPEWIQSIGISSIFFGREVPQKLVVGCCFARRREPRELVRIDLEFPVGFPLASVVRQSLKMEIAPFIIGVGEIIVQETTEGLVISRIDRQEFS